MKETNVQLRRATVDDLDTLVRVARALPMPVAASGETRSGGFLLDPAALSQRVQFAQVWLLELDGHAAGFSLSFDDPHLRASELWQRREQIRWNPGFDVASQLGRRIAYLHQLAVLPTMRARAWGAALGLRALFDLFERQGHDLLLTTTMLEPVHNRAALSYLDRVGAHERGRLEEQLPGVGPIVSAIHVLEAEDFRARFETTLRHARPVMRRVLEAGRSS